MSLAVSVRFLLFRLRVRRDAGCVQPPSRNLAGSFEKEFSQPAIESHTESLTRARKHTDPQQPDSEVGEPRVSDVCQQRFPKLAERCGRKEEASFLAEAQSCR